MEPVALESLQKALSIHANDVYVLGIRSIRYIRCKTSIFKIDHFLGIQGFTLLIKLNALVAQLTSESRM